MNTPTGKLLTQERHRFMQQYLQQFLKEWHAEDEIPLDETELIPDS